MEKQNLVTPGRRSHVLPLSASDRRIVWQKCVHVGTCSLYFIRRSASESYKVFTRSSKRPALARRVFWIHLLEVCGTFAGSCKHPVDDVVIDDLLSARLLCQVPSAFGQAAADRRWLPPRLKSPDSQQQQTQLRVSYRLSCRHRHESDRSLIRQKHCELTQRRPLASSDSHVPTRRPTVWLFRSFRSRANSNVRFHVVVYCSESSIIYALFYVYRLN